MAQIEQYKGKLGFEHRSEEKLTLALTELLDTLEEFGHPALQINARDPHRIGLDTDQYRVSLRLRRIPLRLGVRTPRGVPAPAAYIELVLAPTFPGACDQEISEILLAIVLKRMTQALDPLVIFWQETSKALTPQQFLGTFEQSSEVEDQALAESPAMIIDQAISKGSAPLVQDCQASESCLPEQSSPKHITPQRPAPQRTASQRVERKPESPKISAAASRLRMADQARAEAEAERARGQERFGSVDEASTVLEQHCDEIQHLPARAKPWRSARPNPTHLGHATYQSVFGQSRIARIIGLPHAMLSATANAFRGIDLVLSVRALVTAMVVLFLHGSGMVQAAARVLLPQ
ncbi:hypothetical protein [Pseudophaeobacter sp.]|uniref:hypothetical protein n=1 Tax=Pseudophaeobacter sp. TaxID=1971739 RepID=UPI003296B0B6